MGTSKGHLDQSRQGVQSTHNKPSSPDPVPPKTENSSSPTRVSPVNATKVSAIPTEKTMYSKILQNGICGVTKNKVGFKTHLF
jgi:hypothetical protein